VTEQPEGTASFRTMGLFAGFGPEDADALLGAGEAVSYPPGQAIFEIGDHGDAMYVILRGEAQVDVGARFHVLRAGDFFGEMAVLAPGKRMATVRADGEVEALRISAEGFQEFLIQRPRVALSIMKGSCSGCARWSSASTPGWRRASSGNQVEDGSSPTAPSACSRRRSMWPRCRPVSSIM